MSVPRDSNRVMGRCGACDETINMDQLHDSAMLRVQPATVAMLKERLVDAFAAWPPAAQTSC